MIGADLYGLENLFIWGVLSFPILLASVASLFAGYCGAEAIVRLTITRHILAAMIGGFLGMSVVVGILVGFALYTEGFVNILIAVLLALLFGPLTAYHLAKGVSVKLYAGVNKVKRSSPEPEA